MSKITNMARSARLFEDLFQFRYFSSRQEHFLPRFLLFLASKQLLLNVFRGIHLLNPEKSRNHFQNCAPCWTSQSKQIFCDVSRASVL